MRTDFVKKKHFLEDWRMGLGIWPLVTFRFYSKGSLAALGDCYAFIEKGTASQRVESHFLVAKRLQLTSHILAAS